MVAGLVAAPGGSKDHQGQMTVTLNKSKDFLKATKSILKKRPFERASPGHAFQAVGAGLRGLVKPMEGDPPECLAEGEPVKQMEGPRREGGLRTRELEWAHLGARQTLAGPTPDLSESAFEPEPRGVLEARIQV